MGRKIGICLSTVGSTVTMVAAWYLMRGPFMGTSMPATEKLLAAIGVLVVGLLLLKSGLSSLIHHSGSSNDRVVISNKKV